VTITSGPGLIAPKISNRPCVDKVVEFAEKVGDPRPLFWTPSQLTSHEQDRLLDFAAYRELVKDFWESSKVSDEETAFRERRTVRHDNR
jgi:hypothetical protein